MKSVVSVSIESIPESRESAGRLRTYQEQEGVAAGSGGH
jgi:hypothetical protein